MTEKFFDCKTLGCLKKLGSMVCNWLIYNLEEHPHHLLTHQIMYNLFILSRGSLCVPEFSAASHFSTIGSSPTQKPPIRTRVKHRQVKL